MVPAGTELDLWQGRVLVSMVGFLFLDTRVRGIPVPFHRNFEEVNLRFYVRRKASDGWRRGVAFIKEIVPRRAVAFVARRLYNENYVALPMRHRVDLADGGLRPGGTVEYGWRAAGGWQRLTACTSRAADRAAAGSEAEFITEHYWGYAAQPHGGCVEYRVEHPSWRVWDTSTAELECDAAALYGKPFAEALAAQPTSAFVAEGSAVVVHQGRRL
jgi:uncharacterized protein YqjF (DUF2071 family)